MGVLRLIWSRLKLHRRPSKEALLIAAAIGLASLVASAAVVLGVALVKGEW